MNSRSSVPDHKNEVTSSRWPSPVPWIGLVVLVGCAVLGTSYWLRTRLPDHITIAGGPEDGRYQQLAKALAEELEHRLGIDVRLAPTPMVGSLHNLHLLESNAVQLGLYQSETKAILESTDDSRITARFVANLYPEYLIPISAASESVDLLDMDNRVVSCNDSMSGDHAMLTLLLDHVARDSSRYEVVSYTDLPDALRVGEVDLAVISCGLGAPVLQRVLAEGGRLAKVPFLETFISKNPALTKRTIPAGFFTMHPAPIPEADFETVTTQAQLLASQDAPVRLVEAVTEIVMDPRFQRRMKLNDLNMGGKEYAMSRPEFPIHVGASHIYNPELKPLLNPDFVEGTEGIRSFLVSIVAAIWLAHRWWKRREMLSQEHRLDRYIRDVLAIEREQIGLDGERSDDAMPLQELLDRVTQLRQSALAEFTAHEMNEDQAVDCFVEMCHALSDKISGKLTRHALRYRAASPDTHQDSNSDRSLS